MKFPEVPGKTPREQFENLVRHVVSVPTAELDKEAQKPRRKKRYRAALKSALVLLGVAVVSCGPQVPRTVPVQGPIVIRMRPPAVVVADTQEAHACQRQCMQIVATCTPSCRVEVTAATADAGRRAVEECLESCARQNDNCLRTCPGATEIDATTSAPP